MAFIISQEHFYIFDNIKAELKDIETQFCELMGFKPPKSPRKPRKARVINLLDDNLKFPETVKKRTLTPLQKIYNRVQAEAARNRTDGAKCCHEDCTCRVFGGNATVPPCKHVCYRHRRYDREYILKIDGYDPRDSRKTVVPKSEIVFEFLAERLDNIRNTDELEEEC